MGLSSVTKASSTTTKGRLKGPSGRGKVARIRESCNVGVAGDVHRDAPP